MALREDLPDVAPPGMPRTGTAEPEAAVFDMSAFEGTSTLIRTPASIPEEVAAVCVETLRTISRDYLAAPSSQGEFPDVDVPAEKTIIKEVERAAVIVAVKGEVFSDFMAKQDYTVLVLHSFSIIGTFVVKN